MADHTEEQPQTDQPQTDRQISAGTTDRMAKYALGLDAAFSTLCGLVLMLGGLFMADTIGVSGWLLPALGFGLLGWANMVTLYAGRQFVRRPELDRVAAGNVAWVVLAIVLILIPGWLTGTGKWALAIITLIVAAFAAVQIAARSGLVPPGEQAEAAPPAT